MWHNHMCLALTQRGSCRMPSRRLWPAGVLAPGLHRKPLHGLHSPGARRCRVGRMRVLGRTVTEKLELASFWGPLLLMQKLGLGQRQLGLD